MIELFQVYIVFAIATGVTSCIFLFWPIVKKAKLEGINNEFTRHPLISVIVYTFIASIFSPILFMVLMIPSASYNYLQGLSKVIREQKS